VLQRRGLDDGHAGRRGLVGGSRGDEDVLVAAAAEEVDVALDLRGHEVDPVDHGVVVPLADRLAHRFGVVHVGGEPDDLLGEAPERARAPVEHGDLHALAHRLADARGADDAAAADEQDLQMRHVRSFARCLRADPSASLPVSARARSGLFRPRPQFSRRDTVSADHVIRLGGCCGPGVPDGDSGRCPTCAAPPRLKACNFTSVRHGRARLGFHQRSIFEREEQTLSRVRLRSSPGDGHRSGAESPSQQARRQFSRVGSGTGQSSSVSLVGRAALRSASLQAYAPKPKPVTANPKGPSITAISSVGGYEPKNATTRSTPAANAAAFARALPTATAGRRSAAPLKPVTYPAYAGPPTPRRMAAVSMVVDANAVPVEGMCGITRMAATARGRSVRPSRTDRSSDASLPPGWARPLFMNASCRIAATVCRSARPRVIHLMASASGDMYAVSQCGASRHAAARLRIRTLGVASTGTTATDHVV